MTTSSSSFPQINNSMFVFISNCIFYSVSFVCYAAFIFMLHNRFVRSITDMLCSIRIKFLTVEYGGNTLCHLV